MKSYLVFTASVLAVVLLCVQGEAASSPSRIVCYLGTWSNYRNGAGKFVVEDIDPFLCTHVVYAFTKLDANNEIAPYDPYLDLKENYGLGAYERFVGLKKKNPNLKTLIAIGGWNEGSIKYSKMATNPQSRTTFVRSCVNFLKRYGFDGIDVDWEYPANRGGSPADKSNFVLLLKEFKEALEPQGLLLTAAVSAGKSTIDTAYDIPGISKYLDFVNLMTYDFNGAWNTFTGHNAPLVGRKDGSGDSGLLNVEFAVKYWLEKGTPSHKLVLGMPLYGRTFTLQDPNQNRVGSPITGKGLVGPYTNEPGFVGYNEICDMFKSDGSWKIVFDQEQKVPYAYRDRQWVSYDDVRSIAMKVDFVKKYNLGGAMVWSIETDDFKGNCNQGKFPLISTIKKNLLKPGKEEEGGNDPNQEVTTIPSTTIRPEDEDKTPDTSSTMCKKPGFAPHPKTCRKFINCVQQFDRLVVFEFDCGPGTVWSKKQGLCTYPHLVPDCSNEI